MIKKQIIISVEVNETGEAFINLQRLSDLERKIFRLYANSVTIEMDSDEDDNYWCRED